MNYFTRIKTLFSFPLYSLAIVIGIYTGIFYSGHNAEEITISIFLITIVLITVFTILILAILNLICKKVFPNQKQRILTGSLFVLFAYYMRLPLFGNGLFEAYIIKPLQTIFFYLPVLGFLILAFYLGYLLTKAYKKIQFLAGVLFASFVCYMLVLFFSNVTTNIYIKPLSKMFIYSALVCLTFYLGWISVRLTSKIAQVILIVSIVSLIVTVPISKIIDNSFTDKWVAKNNHSIPSDVSSYIFKKKPNIYFILLDSYTSVEGLKLLGLDTSDFISNLQKRDFKVNRSFYANYDSTMESMPSYFNMNIYNNGIKIHEIPWLIKQQMIAGQAPVYEVFKKNGYKINIMHEDNYLTAEYCFADYCYPLQKPINKFLKIFDIVVLNDNLEIISGNLYKTLKKQHVLLSGGPHFTYLHFHSPGHALTTDFSANVSCREDQEKYEYSSRIDKANSMTIELIDKINEKDHDSIIIIASDHGPYVTDSCVRNGSLLNTKEEIVLRNSTFLAIKNLKGGGGRPNKKFCQLI